MEVVDPEGVVEVQRDITPLRLRVTETHALAQCDALTVLLLALEPDGVLLGLLTGVELPQGQAEFEKVAEALGDTDALRLGDGEAQGLGDCDVLLVPLREIVGEAVTLALLQPLELLLGDRVELPVAHREGAAERDRLPVAQLVLEKLEVGDCSALMDAEPDTDIVYVPLNVRLPVPVVQVELVREMVGVAQAVAGGEAEAEREGLGLAETLVQAETESLDDPLNELLTLAVDEVEAQCVPAAEGQ